MNYAGMSDFEINKAVGSAIGINWANLDSNYHALSIWDDGELCVFEPCNSWVDAGPIIQSNGMTLIKLTNGNWVCVSEFIDSVARRYSISSHNPLRAAMIVFLMMQGNDNA